MAENSMFWDTAAGLGDGADTYSAAQVRGLFRAAFTTDRYSSEGVLAGVLNSLAVSGSATPVAVASGCAIVQGIYYQNTASVSITVSTPTAGTTWHRVVLRATWGSSGQTVRAVLLSGTDGVASYPALTQQDNSRWEIPLAGVQIDTSGAITLVDQRDYAHYATALIERRQGGSSSSWNTAGSTNYRPGGVKRQMGVAELEWDDEDESDKTTVTFPSAFSQRPLVWVTLLNATDSQKRKLMPTIESLSNTQVVIRGQRTDGSSDLTLTCNVMWIAEGQE